MRPVEVLDLRADITAKAQTAEFRKAMTYCIAAADFTARSLTATDRARLQQAAEVANYVPVSLQYAENYYVAPDMCDLIVHAANMLDATDLADNTLPPSRSGFAYFDKPLCIRDIRQSDIYVNAILWDVSSEGTYVIHMWDDEYRHPDAVARQMVAEGVSTSRITGRWGYIGVALYDDGDQIGDPEIQISEEIIKRYEHVEGVIAAPFTNPTRLFHAFWLLLNQTLVARDVERGDRRAARRMRFMNVPNEVTVITFRRREHHDDYEGESAVEWNHRWLVRGHWRWQPYKDEDGNWQHRRQFIAPYIKGPENRPLVITQKVNAFVR